MQAPFPPIEPYAQGLLDVGDGNAIYWETCGNPEGKPALVVHGGPGSGVSAGPRKSFDPDRYRIILFDQRGCGRSVPHASDPTADMQANTTEHLIADMERLRVFLGVERWLLFGGSWGATLSLAYAERYPERVSGAVIPSVTTSRRSEIDWLYRGVARFFPAEWEMFRAEIPKQDRTGDLVSAYARRMEDPDPVVRSGAAARWLAWEDTVLSLEPGGTPTPYSDRTTAAGVAFVRICAHYFSHAAWLEEGALIRDAVRLAGIPGVLIHGRLDLSCPLNTAWEVSQAWPGSELIVIGDAGHKGSDAMHKAVYDALDRFSRTAP